MIGGGQNKTFKAKEILFSDFFLFILNKTIANEQKITD